MSALQIPKCFSLFLKDTANLRGGANTLYKGAQLQSEHISTQTLHTNTCTCCCSLKLQKKLRTLIDIYFKFIFYYFIYIIKSKKSFLQAKRLKKV